MTVRYTTSIALNTPEVPACDGFDIFGLCAPPLLVGLVLGTFALSIWHAYQALRQQGRVLNGEQQIIAPVLNPPRVSLVRLAPPPDGGRRDK